MDKLRRFLRATGNLFLDMLWPFLVSLDYLLWLIFSLGFAIVYDISYLICGLVDILRDCFFKRRAR
jgi:hypothetical protein